MPIQHGKRTIGLVVSRLHPTTNRKLGVILRSCNADAGNGTGTTNPHNNPRLQIQLRSVHRGSSGQHDTCRASCFVYSFPYKRISLRLRQRSTVLNMSSILAPITQKRDHSGHHHHHHHHHDNTYLVSKNKKDAAVRITRIGLYINLSMALGKGFGGYAFHSQGKRTSLFLPLQATFSIE